jgi:hypothetical protein
MMWLLGSQCALSRVAEFLRDLLRRHHEPCCEVVGLSRRLRPGICALGRDFNKLAQRTPWLSAGQHIITGLLTDGLGRVATEHCCSLSVP